MSFRQQKLNFSSKKKRKIDHQQTPLPKHFAHQHDDSQVHVGHRGQQEFRKQYLAQQETIAEMQVSIDRERAARLAAEEKLEISNSQQLERTYVDRNTNNSHLLAQPKKPIKDKIIRDSIHQDMKMHPAVVRIMVNHHIIHTGIPIHAYMHTCIHTLYMYIPSFT